MAGCETKCGFCPFADKQAAIQRIEDMLKRDPKNQIYEYRESVGNLGVRLKGFCESGDITKVICYVLSPGLILKLAASGEIYNKEPGGSDVVV